MRRTLTDDEFSAQLRDYARTAYRLEMQPAYWVAAERETVAKFCAGTPEPPTDVAGFRGWFEQVARQTADGKRMWRVRIHDEPPTDYQRWLRWADWANTDAGERIEYLTRDQAHKAGLLPAAGPHDWWLFDDERLMVMTFNAEGRRIHTELITDEPAVQQARTWWDLAIHTTRGESND